MLSDGGNEMKAKSSSPTTGRNLTKKGGADYAAARN